ncbi:MAG: tRNA (adenosine(37)-N6)-threonylcarbamoyltransferase complex dimerization subunit type 1 TsaB [Tenericutes bacterium]|jgi:tRNA threonylcarbamoyladenosine biosynthesis protein TsaB|nr:tRNA (adenosine(37)-N6)-threonylcarbamoyltransferase complex dimerization subunit type 1 TsaB [Mycoplasmatota bacterium]
MKKSFKRLVIDTATKYMYIALVINDLEVGYVYQVGDNNHSVTIMPLLEELLQKQSIELKDLDEIIVGVGPGSYTGVRIGVTVGKMIAYLNGIKVSTVSSLALMASHSDDVNVLPLIDARRGNAFMAFFKQENHRISYVEEDVLMNIDLFKSKHKEPYDVLESGKPQIEKVLNSDLLTEIGNIHELVPNYLQVTEAERNLKK